MSQRSSIDSLELKNITYGYEGVAPVFQGINIKFPTSKAVWIRSPGGRGKSTLLKLLVGLVSPHKGSYLINGADVSQMSFEEFLPYRLNIGYGFDMGGLINNKSLAENLILPLLYHKLLTVDQAFERVKLVTDIFGLQEVRDLRPFAVPGSQRKLTCVLRAFVHSPEVVFLDEPMTGLKQDNLNDLFRFVDEAYKSGSLRQIYFTSESPEMAKQLGAEELLISTDTFTMRNAA